KEINLDNNKKLIFLFRQQIISKNLVIQVIVYNDLENDDLINVIGTDIIFKDNIQSNVINSDNIIYNKESNENHSLYWCDGVNPDKVINFNTSLNPSDYADF